MAAALINAYAVRPLAWLGRQGTRAIAALVLLGIAVPPLGERLKPFVAEAVFLLLCISFMRVDLSALRDQLRQPGIVVAAALWTTVAVPAVTGAICLWGGVEQTSPDLYLALMLQAVASPMMASPALAALMGLDSTLVLITLGIGLALVAGVPLGAFSALRRGHRPDTFLLLTQMTLHSIPPFLIATFLLIIFAVVLKWLPYSGSANIGRVSAPGVFEMLTGNLKHLILPVAALAVWESTAIYYFTRSALVDILGEDYILVARAKGLSEKVVLFRHALRVALPTLSARFALVFGTAVGGAFFVEDVFNFPGIATLALSAFRNYDYTLMRGVFLVLTVSILAVNFIADICLYKLDPRTLKTG